MLFTLWQKKSVRVVLATTLVAVLLNLALSFFKETRFNLFSLSFCFVSLQALAYVAITREKLDVVITCKNKAFSIKGIYVFVLSFIFIFSAYHLLLNPHFSTDTYGVYYDLEGTLAVVSSNGRIVIWAVLLLLSKLNINVVNWQVFFTFFLILSSSFSCTLLTQKFVSHKIGTSITEFLVIVFSVLLSFANVFFVEWYLFSEVTLTFAISILGATLAIVCLSERKSFIFDFLSFLFLAISLNTYQATIGFYFTYSVALVFYRNKQVWTKKTWMELARIFCIGFAAGLSNVLIVRLMLQTGFISAASREVHLSSILTSIKIISANQITIASDLYGLLPKYSLALFGLATLLACAFIIKKCHTRLKDIFGFLFLASLAYLSVYIPHILSDTVWMAPRTLVSLFSFITFIYLFLLIKTKDSRIQKYLLITIFCFLLLNIYQIHDISMNHIASNKIDDEFCNFINQKIVDYENETGIQVVNIATRTDPNPTYGYESVDYVVFDTNLRSFVKSWSDVNSINYYTGQSFVKVGMPDEIYETYFEGQDWDSFDFDQQAVFVGDTLYLMVY